MIKPSRQTSWFGR